MGEQGQQLGGALQLHHQRGDECQLLCRVTTSEVKRFAITLHSSISASVHAYLILRRRSLYRGAQHEQPPDGVVHVHVGQHGLLDAGQQEDEEVVDVRPEKKTSV